MSRLSMRAGLVACVGAIALTSTAVHAGLKPVTVVDLIDRAEIITAGTVVSVRDGYDDQNIPFTEITLDVDQTLKGTAGGTFTFRQFGLMKPRQRDNGSWDLNVTPQEWPTYHEDESTVLFLFEAATYTGFRSPIGLAQGALRVVDDEIVNQFATAGLFRDVVADPGLLTSEEEALFTHDGPLPGDTFLEFVRRAVNENWIDEGRLNHVEP